LCPIGQQQQGSGDLDVARVADCDCASVRTADVAENGTAINGDAIASVNDNIACPALSQKRCLQNGVVSQEQGTCTDANIATRSHRPWINIAGNRTAAKRRPIAHIEDYNPRRLVLRYLL
jgi:hypothetical protein